MSDIVRGIKRPAEDAGGKSKHRNKKRQYYQPKGNDAKKGRGKKIMSLAAGMKGVLVTCPVGKEAKCVMETYRLLQEFHSDSPNASAPAEKGPADAENDSADDADDADDTGGDSDDESDSEQDDSSRGRPAAQDADEDLSIEDALARELHQLQEERASGTRAFQSVKTGVKGVVFIKVDASIQPTQLVQSILESMFTSKVVKTRFISRLLPIEGTSYAKVEDISKAVKRLLPTVLEEGKVLKFSVAPRHSSTQAVDRDELIRELVTLVRESAQAVDYKSPDVVIAVETILNVSAIGFLRNYDRFDKYRLNNLRDSLGLSWKARQAAAATAAAASAARATPEQASSSSAPVDVPVTKDQQQ